MKKATGLAAISHIHSLKDVKTFFKALNRKLHLGWHPDTLFQDYVKGNLDNNAMFFLPKEATRLNRLMNMAFSVCQKHGLDLYQIAYDSTVNMRRVAGIGVTKRTKKH
jgi:hypothetical protein